MPPAVRTRCPAAAAPLQTVHTSREPPARAYTRLTSVDSSLRRTTAMYSISIGAALGSIMAIIITAHIANSRSRCRASQVDVIDHADAPVIGPYMSALMARIHHQ